MRTCCSNDATACSTAPENLYGWAPHHQNPALAASLALSRFLYATELLVSVVFPHGPLLEEASPGDLTTQQYAASHAALHSGLTGDAAVSRLLRRVQRSRRAPAGPASPAGVMTERRFEQR